MSLTQLFTFAGLLAGLLSPTAQAAVLAQPAPSQPVLCQPGPGAGAAPQRAQDKRAPKTKRQDKGKRSKDAAQSKSPKKKRPTNWRDQQGKDTKAAARAKAAKAKQGPSALAPLRNPIEQARPLTERERLKRYDANGNQRLDAVELRTAQREDAVRKQAMNQLLRQYDRNKNGIIDKDETQRILGELAAARRRSHEQQYDVDEDGSMDPEERAAMLRDLDQRRAAMVQGKAPSGAAVERRTAAEQAKLKAQRLELARQFDADGDGKLSPDELQALARFEQDQRIAAVREERGDDPLPKPAPKRETARAERSPSSRGSASPSQRMVARYDTDKDGKLSPEEEQAARRDIALAKRKAAETEQATTPAEPKTRPAKAQARAEGQATGAGAAAAPPRAEAPKGPKKVTAAQGQKAQEFLMKRFDRNGDGEFSEAEKRAIKAFYESKAVREAKASQADPKPQAAPEAADQPSDKGEAKPKGREQPKANPAGRKPARGKRGNQPAAKGPAGQQGGGQKPAASQGRGEPGAKAKKKKPAQGERSRRKDAAKGA